MDCALLGRQLYLSWRAELSNSELSIGLSNHENLVNLSQGSLRHIFGFEEKDSKLYFFVNSAGFIEEQRATFEDRVINEMRSFSKPQKAEFEQIFGDLKFIYGSTQCGKDNYDGLIVRTVLKGALGSLNGRFSEADLVRCTGEYLIIPVHNATMSLPLART